MAVTVHPADRRVVEHLDIGGLLDSFGEVPGHVFVQVVAPDQKQHLASLSGKKNCRLTGRITTTDNDGLQSATELALGDSRGIVDTRALEPVAPLDAQLPVVCPGGDQEAL